LPTKILILLVFLCSCATSTKKHVSNLVPYEQVVVINTLNELIASHQFSPDNIGFILKNERGDIEIQHNADQMFIPASTNKLFTAAAVVDSFKGHEQFATELRYEGILRQNEGLLDGNLYLVGNGDSTFNSHGMMNLLLTLRKLGIKKVLGGFYYDDSSMPVIERIEESQGHTFSYNPSLSALSFDFNQMALIWEQDSENLKYFFLPAIGAEQDTILGEHLITDDGNIEYRDRTWVISNETSGKGSTRLPYKNSALMTAMMMRKMAADMGIELPTPDRRKPSRQSKLLTNHMSATISEQMGNMLLFSNNLMAETHLIHSASKHDRVSDLKSAVALQKKRFQQLGLDVTGMNPVNGSGLAASARFSPKGLLEIVSFLSRKTKGRILSKLPISGKNGTLRRRMKEPSTAFKVWAKTGTMNYASCLAGYLLHEGQIKEFALMVNDIPKRTELDSEEDPEKKKALLDQTSAWIRRAREFQDAVFLHLVKNPNFN
jgi:D-alanyl-D-alanine carboxypeptidase/D-alanyl-D-alanine-endopeptidase (penicillin-binding protein 4)